MTIALTSPKVVYCVSNANIARVAELVDATDSKSVGSDVVGVRVPPRALKSLKFVQNLRLLLFVSGQAIWASG